MHTFTKSLGITATAVILTLGGCSSKLDTADAMRGHAQESQAQGDRQNQFAKDWEQGAALVKTGEQRIRDGEKLIQTSQTDMKAGQEQIDQGNREITLGKKMMLESEQRSRKDLAPETSGGGK